MTIATIAQVEDGILALLNADSTIIDTWKATVLSADDMTKLSSTERQNYPLIIVGYMGSPDPDGPLAGGTGKGGEYARKGRWNIYLIDKNLRSDGSGRTGDPNDDTAPGIYAMIERMFATVIYKQVIADIGFAIYAGDRMYDYPWDKRTDAQVMAIDIQFETVATV